MKGAIPVLHSALAWTCLFLNIFLPGIGKASIKRSIPPFYSHFLDK
jgi:hypothetical protein